MHSAKNNSKVTDPEWHRFRDRARNEAFSPEEFTEAERVRYNLDSDDALAPAGITGEDTDATYVGDEPPTTDAPVDTDIRDSEVR